MLLVDTVIILGAYAGLRLKEYYQTRKQAKCDKPSTQSLAYDEKKQQHYVNSGVGAITLSTLSFFYAPLRLAGYVLIIYNALPIIRQSEDSLIKQRKIDNDTLSAVVCVLSLGLGAQLVAAIQTFVYHLGVQMVNRSKDLSDQALSDIFNCSAERVWVVREEVEIEIGIEEVQCKDIIVARTGEVIFVDGTIIKGDAFIDQQVLTGESMPVEKSVCDEVFAGTWVASGEIRIQVEKTGLETTAAQLKEIVESTGEFKTDLQLKGEYWADASALPLLAGSMISTPLIGLSSAINILFSAPTNTIQVMTSMQTNRYMTMIANRRILIKDGSALETLKQIDVVLFDKTGTLTEKHPKVSSIQSFGSYSETRLLTFAATAERRLSHPIAEAIRSEAEKRQIECLEIEASSYKLGLGVDVKADGKLIQLGSHRFMQNEKINLPTTADPAAVFIAVDGQAAGCITLEGNVRAEAPDVIASLRQSGIDKIFIVSGDHQQPTEAVAGHLKIDDCYYGALPQEKADIVEQLQHQGHKVCFVGDGVNDTLAMQQADVSISLAGASSITTDVAQIVFMDGNLAQLNTLIELANQLNGKIEKSLLFWAGFGAGNIAVATFLPMGLLASTLIFGSVFSLGIGHSALSANNSDS